VRAGIDAGDGVTSASPNTALTLVQCLFGSIGQNLIHPLIYRLRRVGGSLGNQAMMRRRCAKSQFAGIWLIRRHTVFGAPVQIVVNAVMKRLFKFVNRSTGKMNGVVQSLNNAVKQTVVCLKPDRLCVSLVRFHCLTPALVKKTRNVLIAPLSVFGFGCGRCITILCPLSEILMREPDPSVIFAPSATSAFSRSRQRIVPLVGRRKIAASIFLCLDRTIAACVGLVNLSLQQTRPTGIGIVSIYDIVKWKRMERI